MVGIVLRTLEDLERVLWVVNEVLVFRPFPLRIPHIQAEVLQQPAFEFSTSVNSVELNLLVGSSLSFDFQIYNLFAEVLYSIPIVKTLKSPPTTLPSPEPSPGPIIIIPSPPSSLLPPSSPSEPPSEPPSDGGSSRLVTWDVKIAVIPLYAYPSVQIEYHISVSRNDGSSIFRHYERRQGVSFEPLPGDFSIGVVPQLRIMNISFTETSLSKTWNVTVVGAVTGIIYASEYVTITVPPFNGQAEPSIMWKDIQTHTVSG
jgi:hypothetical protein